MNPTSNKKDFDELTTNLKDLAYSYLEKYNPSKQQLKIYLLKKYLTKQGNSQSKKNLSNIIDKVLENLEKNKLINDEMYSDSKARNLLRRGYSINKIYQSLIQKGIKNEFIKKSITKIKNIIVGTHGDEHDNCLKLLLEYGFQVKLNFTSDEIPIQPDGLLWAYR